MAVNTLETRVRKIEAQMKLLGEMVADIDRRMEKANRSRQRALLGALHEHLGLVVYDNGGGGAHVVPPKKLVAKLQQAVEEGRLKT